MVDCSSQGPSLISNYSDLILRCFGQWFNASPPGQNDHHFIENMFRYIFLNDKFSILITISLKFLPKGPIDNDPAMV